jgi:cytochrome c
MSQQARNAYPTTWALAGAIGVIVAATWTGTVQAQDAAAGKQVYDKTCLGCHGDATTPGANGPSLVNLIGRKAGSSATGVVSRANAEAPIVWNETTLDQYLSSPSEKIHGTIMPVSVKDAGVRANLIAYIKTMTKN